MADDLPILAPQPRNPALLPPAVQDMVRSLLGGVGDVASHIAGIPKRAFEASENLRMGGDYDPAPVVEAASMLTGAGMPMAEAGAVGATGGKLWGPAGMRMVANTGKEGAAWHPTQTHPFTETPGSMEHIDESMVPIYEALGHKVGTYINKTTHEPVHFKENITQGQAYSNLKAGGYADDKGTYVGESSPWKPTGINSSGNEYFPDSIKTEGVPDYLPTQIPDRATAAGFNVPLAHGTKTEKIFDAFALPEERGATFPRAEIGVHAGSPRAANKFGGTYTSNYDSPRIYPLVMRAQNPLETTDLGNWGPTNIVGYLRSHPEFGGDVVSKALGGKEPVGMRDVGANEQIQALRDLIRSKGYDSIKYQNAVEDPGHTSYIALDPKQLRSPWAAFKDLESRNLLAGLAGGVVAAPALTPGVQDYVKALNK